MHWKLVYYKKYIVNSHQSDLLSKYVKIFISPYDSTCSDTAKPLSIYIKIN